MYCLGELRCAIRQTKSPIGSAPRACTTARNYDDGRGNLIVTSAAVPIGIRRINRWRSVLLVRKPNTTPANKAFLRTLLKKELRSRPDGKRVLLVQREPGRWK